MEKPMGKTKKHGRNHGCLRRWERNPGLSRAQADEFGIKSE